jgi:hypothetical protein
VEQVFDVASLKIAPKIAPTTAIPPALPTPINPKIPPITPVAIFKKKLHNL